jgi:hypothetical protein
VTLEVRPQLHKRNLLALETFVDFFVSLGFEFALHEAEPNNDGFFLYHGRLRCMHNLGILGFQIQQRIGMKIKVNWTIIITLTKKKVSN